MSTEETAPIREVSPELQQSWQLLLAAGVVIAALGVVAFFTPFVTGVALTVLLGALLVVGALVHAAYTFRAGGWQGMLWQALLAVLYAFAGISLLVNPVVGLATLTLLVVAYFLVQGVLEVVLGFTMRSQARWWLVVLSGAVSLVLAGLLWVGFPSTALWAVGVLFGVNLLATGASLIGVALTGRDAQTTQEGEMPGARIPGAGQS